MGKKGENIKVVAVNRKVRRLYDLLESIEAGMVLTGTEIKSIRAGKVSFKDCYVHFKAQEAFLTGLHIGQYENAGYTWHVPDRDRKLLLHRREIDNLRGKVEQKGLTLVPTRVYLKNSKAKVELALARGRKVQDQREELKRRAMALDMAREMKDYK
ncbi:MAG: SsrA-binding protein SmpB [Desulfohalobiaceae bacterium]